MNMMVKKSHFHTNRLLFLLLQKNLRQVILTFGGYVLDCWWRAQPPSLSSLASIQFTALAKRYLSESLSSVLSDVLLTLILYQSKQAANALAKQTHLRPSCLLIIKGVSNAQNTCAQLRETTETNSALSLTIFLFNIGTTLKGHIIP